MPRKESKAPRGRINIVYNSDQGLQKIDEIPMKFAVLGDFTGKQDPEDSLADRKMQRITRQDFDTVMNTYRLSLDALTVPDRLSEQKDATLTFTLKFNKLEDFMPGNVIKQMEASSDEVKKAFRLREALLSVKNPMSTNRSFRSQLQNLVDDKDTRERLMRELGIEPDAST
jgi:type VI secretion system protein ImpB